jgi:hypothetical protein
MGFGREVLNYAPITPSISAFENGLPFGGRATVYEVFGFGLCNLR